MHEVKADSAKKKILLPFMRATQWKNLAKNMIFTCIKGVIYIQNRFRE
jgi:hypothetical protein